jgi:hypothetical protein
MNAFYTYLYIDPSRAHSRVPEGEPIYVGKGQKDRVYRHLCSIKKHPFIQRLQKMKREGVEPIIKFLFKDIDEELAFLVEEEAIDLYGRKDLGKGTLLNLTDGGEGRPGSKFVMTQAHKDAIAIAKRGKRRPPEFGRHMSQVLTGRKLTATHIENSANSRRGVKHTPEHIAKMVAAQQGIPKPRQACIYCGRMFSAARLSQYHGEKCKSKN